MSKQPNKHRLDAPKRNRSERLEVKYRNTLLCEWCNRHSPVSYELYKKVKEFKEKGKEYIYCCRRENCINSRSESFSPFRRK